MESLLKGALSRPKTVFLIFLFLWIGGLATYLTAPKEDNPPIELPILFVTVTLDGVAPEDAERLILRSLENELRSVPGLKSLHSTAYSGGASATLEFFPNVDHAQTLAEVRAKVNIARAEMPSEIDEPLIEEVNLALQPIIAISISGPVSEGQLTSFARNLRNNLELIPSVQSADIVGAGEEVLEIAIEPKLLESYRIGGNEIVDTVSGYTRLIPAGTLASRSGEYPVKMPSTIRTAEDLLTLPVKSSPGAIVELQDVAVVRRGIADRKSIARVNNVSTITIEVRKRIGENIIDTAEKVRATTEEQIKSWPKYVSVSYSNDVSQFTRQVVGDLENSVLFSIILVIVVSIGLLGIRNAALIAAAIPGSFFAGFLILSLFGVSFNSVVYFSLVIAAGMLVDGAIVVTEYADRLVSNGAAPKIAYYESAVRMFWPIVSSTMTTLAAFVPMLFWPDTIGEFIKYTPITLIAVLTASLFVALIIVPVSGAHFVKAPTRGARSLENHDAAEASDFSQFRGLSAIYLSIVKFAMSRPVLIVLSTLSLLVLVFGLFLFFGRGVELFPTTDPDTAVITVRARGDMSIVERDEIVRAVESKIGRSEDIANIYTRTERREPDIIGDISIEFEDWKIRKQRSTDIMREIRANVSGIPGVITEVRDADDGPGGSDKPIQIEVSAESLAELFQTVDSFRTRIESMDGLESVADNRSSFGIEWRVEIDRTKAAQFGVDANSVGSFIQMVTTGLKVGEYRPDDVDDEVDIRVRFPPAYRSISQLQDLRINTDNGLLPVSQLVQFSPREKVSGLTRVRGRRTITISADVKEGENEAAKIAEIKQELGKSTLPHTISYRFVGQDEEQRNSERFLETAFAIALALMGIILVTQFNSFYQVFVILASVIFSLAGVFIGLLVLDRPFGIVLGGVGVISLAGIVVNNNIILVDTFNHLRAAGLSAFESILQTCAQRLRPVLLTAVTTVIGLMPMVLNVNVDLIGRHITFGGPISQFWSQMATAIAFGLTFATALTLIVTPSMLALANKKEIDESLSRLSLPPTRAGGGFGFSSANHSDNRRKNAHRALRLNRRLELEMLVAAAVTALMAFVIIGATALND